MAAQSKTLSNGTMALKFMQNAQRMKNQAQVELERAKIKDDAEWEVAQDVREAWGLSTLRQPQTTVTYEQSYLPFLFAQDDEDAPSSSQSMALKVRGRRSFKENGEETQIGEKKVKFDTNETQENMKDDTRLAPLSGGATSATKVRKEDKQKKRDIHGKERLPIPVLQMISDEKGVGVDMKAAHKSHGDDSSSIAFLRPAGVDSPSVNTEVRSQPKADPLEAQRSKRAFDGENKQDGEQRKKKKKKRTSAE